MATGVKLCQNVMVATWVAQDHRDAEMTTGVG